MKEKFSDIDQSVSVALCTCNGSRFLAEQLQSIVVQTRLPQELVICDDASTDDTVSIIQAFSRSTPFPVKLFQNSERLGPAKNFEKAIRLCEGEIIFLCDQDDCWKPLKVERMVQALEKHPQAIYAFSNAEMVDENGITLDSTLWDAVGLSGRLESFSGDGQLKILLKQNIVTGAAMAFRTSFRDSALPIMPDWMHDHWIVLLGSAVSFGVPVPEVLLSYRRHGSQVCGWKKQTFWEVCMESMQARTEDWTQKVANFRDLLERVEAISRRLPCPPERMTLLRDKEKHLVTRCHNRGSNGLARIGRVLAEASTGRYQRFSDSWYSIVRDL
jgi:glycosyltransferase involved in cell wall biosynthesis